ncbi:hypothetical protein BFU36_01265 [Sulfolobus sp. A20]|uniref:hypothetical protein n=1 Tax=Saccharolobus sp. A20 TaxID=1891280 RepID=UPI00084606C6|nr:hypothetical protein [Sulfolobus sp. A20]TRM74831.1 hypothetical protein DJ528_09985 [Sulfolobus sp. B5]TRM77168.1 hypothetical protein DJ532_05515 [Sulfolobus sp. A20-N-F8]TRM80295.1 hypothetical protein DJ524_08115 [Sulfolobus sp. D5]TRM85425.1 hypothetical protein DJ522_00805 [Sulfolobus sp. F3]TRM88910.1 hypothetical protein DJ529_03685 [Sulfolobus sp. C3]TRM90270.1 hypothetical protein DJ526_07570 [Sulfolobus sp. A20-N-G8]TRN02118.1 hypothetical protein DJ530_04700 [Sulfolobus sp. E1
MLDEILRRELSQEDITEISEEEFKKYILLIKKSSILVDRDIREEELKLLSELAESLFEVRLSKVLEGKVAKGFDADIISVVNLIKQFYIFLFTGQYIVYNDKIYCKVVKNVMIDDYKLEEGDIVFLSIKEALPLIIASYLTPFKIDNGG